MKIEGLRMRGGSAFHRDLRQRVDAWFTETGKDTHGDARMWRKSAALIAGFALMLGGFWLSDGGWAAIVGFGIPLGLLWAGLGFSVMHDGNHAAYSTDKRVNRGMGFVLDIIGGSSYLWRHKHNRVHHSHPNVVGVDDDLEAGFFLRMAPGQDWLPMHRMQQWYMWPLYGFIAIKWHIMDDYAQMMRGHINDVPFARPKGRDLAEFVVGKLLFHAWAIVIPALIFGLGTAALFWLLSAFVCGIALAVVFQLAHCVEEADFVVPPTDGSRIELDWAELQLATTVDFAPNNPLATWYLGGLNFQVVHHLFPRICHVHYPELAKIVAATAADHGLKYRCNPTVRAALASHFRWMRRMGRTPEAAPEATPALPAAEPALR